MISEKQLSEFIDGYVAALLWSSMVYPEDGEPENADKFELSTAGRDKCEADCRAFCEKNAALVCEAIEIPDYDASQAGHDFALTRNGHGAGYWDREDLPIVLGELLTSASHRTGEVYAQLNDANEVEFF